MKIYVKRSKNKLFVFVSWAVIVGFIGFDVTLAKEATQSLPAIALQLYTVRDELGRDFEGTLKKISGMGYTQVEWAGYYGKTPAEIQSILSQTQLTAVATHVPYKDLKKDPQKLCQESADYGNTYMVIAWVPPLERITHAQYRKLAERFNQAGRDCKKVGVQFIYHNHDFEFKGKTGSTPYDILLKETDTSLVKFELDLFWITKAGKDPLYYLQNYPGRFTHFHVKDKDKKNNMVDVGQGNLNFALYFREGQKHGVQYFIVEHDNPKHSLPSAQASLNYLQKLKF